VFYGIVFGVAKRLCAGAHLKLRHETDFLSLLLGTDSRSGHIQESKEYVSKPKTGDASTYHSTKAFLS
jgi:hypothetical protein